MPGDKLKRVKSVKRWLDADNERVQRVALCEYF